jgi:site-specific recombinase XerD
MPGDDAMSAGLLRPELSSPDLVVQQPRRPTTPCARPPRTGWAQGLPGRSAKTIRKNRDVLQPILAAVGTRRLKELTSADVDAALAQMAASHSTAAVAMGHLAAKRVIRRAQARRHVNVNTAELADTPRDRRAGQADHSPLDQAAAVLRASVGTRTANMRREFRAAVKAAGIEGIWSPRELRHTFVSLMSDSGVPVEEIARLAGHTNSRTTEIVCRHQLRPVMEKAPRPWTSCSDAPPDQTLATHARS